VTHSSPFSIWATGLVSPLGYGGWAWLVVRGGVALGRAGGERKATDQRMRLTALLEAMTAAASDPAAPLRLHLKLAAPEGDADLWRGIVAARAARTGPVTLVTTPVAAAEAFVQEWATLAQERVKQSGAFAFPIPKHILASIGAKTSGQP
jgi:ribonuclease HI